MRSVELGEVEMDFDQVPPADVGRASAARVYNFYLGGAENFPVDQEFGRQMIAAVPEVPIVARLNRAFLRRAVRTCVRAGIRQFLDIGSGIPGPDSVLDFATTVEPSCRVVYADFEPIAVEHGRRLLSDDPRAAMIWADLRDRQALLATPEAGRLLDLGRPVGLLMLGLLHYLSDDEDPYAIVAGYRDQVAAGSHLVLSHGTDEGRPAPVRAMIDLAATSQNPAYMRNHAQVTRFLDGFTVLDPGVVHLPDWRPDTDDESGTETARLMAYGAVGRKP